MKQPNLQKMKSQWAKDRSKYRYRKPGTWYLMYVVFKHVNFSLRVFIIKCHLHSIEFLFSLAFVTRRIYNPKLGSKYHSRMSLNEGD